jgi:hypothetical protein
MNEIADFEALEKWLKEQSLPLATALAARAVLRVLPVGLSDYPVGTGPEQANRNAIAQLRAHSVVRSALRSRDMPTAQLALRQAMARKFPLEGHHDISEAIRYMLRAADAAMQGLSVTNDLAFKAISSLIHRDGMLEAILADRAFSGEGGLDTATLLACPLWLSSRPRWFEQALSRTYEIWLKIPEDWQVWNLWYDWRLDGQPNEWGMSPPADEEMRDHLLRVDDEFWKRSEGFPALINREIIDWANQLFHTSSPTTNWIWPDEVRQIDPLNTADTDQLEWLSAQRRNEVDVAAEVLRLLDGVSRSAAMVVALRAVLRGLPIAQPALLGDGHYASPESWEWTANRVAMLASGIVRLGVSPASLAALKPIDEQARSIFIEDVQGFGPSNRSPPPCPNQKRQPRWIWPGGQRLGR